MSWWKLRNTRDHFNFNSRGALYNVSSAKGFDRMFHFGIQTLFFPSVGGDYIYRAVENSSFPFIFARIAFP
jgi:hypothetical protein